MTRRERVVLLCSESAPVRALWVRRPKLMRRAVRGPMPRQPVGRDVTVGRLQMMRSGWRGSNLDSTCTALAAPGLQCSVSSAWCRESMQWRFSKALKPGPKLYWSNFQSPVVGCVVQHLRRVMPYACGFARGLHVFAAPVVVSYTTNAC